MLQSLLCFLLAVQSGESDFLVVEIAGKGPKAFVISHDFRLIDSKNVSASPLKGMADGLMTEPAMQDCLKATITLAREMAEPLKQKGQNFKVMMVASSSVSVAKNFPSFKSTLEKQMAVKIDSVTADEEASLIFSTIVPPSMRQNGMALDIGSGNSRLAWHQDGLLKQVTIQIGTVVATNMASTSKDLALEIRGLLPSSPNVNGKHLYVVGGIAWAMNSFLNPNDKTMDLRKIRALDFERNKVPPEVVKVFSRENLTAGRVLFFELLRWTSSDLGAVEFVNQPGSWTMEWLKKKVTTKTK